MRKAVWTACLAVALVPSVALAEAGDIVVRVRAAHVSPDVDSKLGSTTNLVSSGGKLDVDNNTIPEIDFSYYITKNIAAELILATGTRHDVSIKNSTGTLPDQPLGSVNLLPPTLTLQWHFLPDQMFDPYVGAGVNYTRFMDRSLATTAGAVGVPIRVDRNSWGAALQVGFDVNLKDGWLINADLKKAWIDTTVKRNDTGAKLDSLDIDPWVFGVGIGKKF